MTLKITSPYYLKMKLKIASPYYLREADLDRDVLQPHVGPGEAQLLADPLAQWVLPVGVTVGEPPTLHISFISKQGIYMQYTCFDKIRPTPWNGLGGSNIRQYSLLRARKTS